MQILYPYQKEVIIELKQRLMNEKEIIIAAAPSSGKTFMITEFIKDNPNSNFLILTHGTTLLKKQWENAFKDTDIKASTILGQELVTYGLPQSIYKKQFNTNKIDYLIIDEAHEFTFAKMIQKTIENCNANKIIYLTGTPSKFIKRGYNPIVIPASRLIEENYISDLYVGMVSTDAKLLEKDYNIEKNVTSNGDLKLTKSIDIDLDNLLLAIHKRLKETKMFKSNPEFRKLVNWAPTLGILNKTMIACNSIEQCKKVTKYFIKHNINVVSSESETDIDSEKIQEFIDNKDIKLLVVVNRGILGFNLPELVNVVDLTCSRNIDRIYQLFARVMRKHPDHDKKYFFKFAPQDHMVLMKFYMEASLSLLFKDFISKYNGKNLNGFEIPILVKKRKRYDSKNNKSLDKVIKHIKPVPIDELFKNSVTALKLLTDIYNKVGHEHNEYAFTTFGKIKSVINNIHLINPEHYKQTLLDMAKNDEKLPKNKSSLRHALTRYTRESQDCYDEEFTKEIKKYWNIPEVFSWTQKKAIEILNSSKHKKYNELRKEYPGMIEAVDRNNWINFKEIVNIKYPTKQNNNSKQSSKELDYWIKKYKRSPKQHSTDLIEKRMSGLFRSRLKNPEFRKKYNHLKYTKQYRFKSVENIETKQIFEKVTDAVKSFGDYSTANLIRSIKYGTKYRGFHWKYI